MDDVSMIDRKELERRWLRERSSFVSLIEAIAEKKGLDMGLQRRSQEIALSLLSKNQSIDFVSEVTGLSKQDVLDLQNKQIL